MRENKELKWILIWILAFTAGYCSAQPGSITQSAYKTRVMDSLATNVLLSNAHQQGYASIYWNAQASTPHWDVWNGESYDHVYSFNSGSNSSNNEIRNLWIALALTWLFLGIVLFFDAFKKKP